MKKRKKPGPATLSPAPPAPDARGEEAASVPSPEASSPAAASSSPSAPAGIDPGASCPSPSFDPPTVLRHLLRNRPNPDAKLALLRRYVELLLAANERANLTGDRSPELQWTRHVEDALRAALAVETPLRPPEPGCRILDVGAGGGVPGIVWAILWPQARVSLLEATGKKTDFLRAAALELGLANVEVVQGRAEELAHDPARRETFDLVVARALAPLRTLAELTMPFARWGGEILAIKSAGVEAEMREATRAFKLLAAPLPPRVVAYERSDGATCRVLLYHKTGLTPSPYPRRANVLKTKPL